MPKETIEIILDKLDPYYSAAQYFAIVAYPDSKDINERENFLMSIARKTIEIRMRMSPEWAMGLRLIRPAYFSGSESQHEATLKRGKKKLDGHLAAARFIAMPHFREIDIGRPVKVDGFAPTVNNMAGLAALHLNMSMESFATVKSKIWGPSKSIIHAATAYIVWSEVLWTMWGRNPDVDRELAFLTTPGFVEEVAAVSEAFRAQLAQIRHFKIREEDTIQLSPLWMQFLSEDDNHADRTEF